MPATHKPLINFRPAQEEAFLCLLGLLVLIWRRQFGKSFTLAGITLDWMMEAPNVLVTLISAAIRLGEENIRKEAEIWRDVMGKLKTTAEISGQHKLTTSADDDFGKLLDVDAIADLFQAQKLRTYLWFDNVAHSRSMIIAPNPDTAVGNTGHVIFDEAGRMPDFRAMWEAAEPFLASRPEFKMRIATTPPPDDTHYSYELFAPPDDTPFPINPRGNFYTSALGLPVHRVDAFDAYAGGVPIYGLKDRKPLTPAEARAQAIDKDAWDRNFGCQFLKGGTGAFGITELAHAQAAGASMGIGRIITEEIRIAA